MGKITEAQIKSTLIKPGSYSQVMKKKIKTDYIFYLSSQAAQNEPYF
jgi:hypothetical protein